MPPNLLKSSVEETAVAIVQHELGLNEGEVAYSSGHSTDTATYAYLSQVHVYPVHRLTAAFLSCLSKDNLPFINAVANLVLNNKGKIVALGSSFVKPGDSLFFGDISEVFDNVTVFITSSNASIAVSDAIQVAEKTFNSIYTGQPVKLQYYAMPDGSATLVHAVQVGDDENFTSREVFVDAHSGRVVGSVDFNVVEPKVRAGLAFSSKIWLNSPF